MWNATSEARNAEVARELHDELGASLTMLKLGLATLADQPPKADASNTFAALLEQVDNALKVTRRISGSLRPATLDTLGLVTTVKSHVRQFSLTTGIETKLIPAKVRFTLPDATNIAVFRIIQEALTNVAKHSGASHVIINARKYREAMIVRIVDDGTGIRDRAMQKPEAFGIIGMRERAQHIGGTLSIGSGRNGRGTRLTLRVPIAPPPHSSPRNREEIGLINVLIADDHAVVRTGLRQFLASTEDMTIIAEASTGADVLAQIATANCDLLLLDINLPDLNGLEVLKRVKRQQPELPVVIFSMFSEDEFALEAMRAGAAGYLNKDSPPGQILSALRTVASGARFLSPELAEKLLTGTGTERIKLPHESLSEREMEVMLMMSQGVSLTHIGQKLHLSVKTISTYRSRILEKLGMQSNADITRYVMQHKLA